MKHLIQTIFVTLMLVFCAIPAYAADYTIDALQMELTIPDEWMTFTQDIAPDDENFNYLDMEYEELIEYLASNDCYLLSFSEDYLSGSNDYPSGIELIAYANWYSKNHYSITNASEHSRKELAKELKEQYEADVTCTGWNIYTSKNQLNYIILQYYYDDNMYYQEYTTICNGQWINLIFSSDGSEITAENAAMQKEIVDSIFINESEKPSAQTTVSEQDKLDSLSPEMLGRLAGGVLVNIFFICVIIFGVWKKVLEWLKNKRDWAAVPEGSDIACQYEKQDCLRKANSEIKIHLVMAMLYFITIYFHIFLCMMGQNAILTLFVLLIYAFYSFIKNRKESLILIDRILADVCPERKKFYHMMLTLLMIIFIILICWPLAVMIYMAGAFILFEFRYYFNNSKCASIIVVKRGEYFIVLTAFLSGSYYFI